MAKVMRVLASYNASLSTSATKIELPTAKSDLANPATPPQEGPANAFTMAVGAATPTVFVAFDRTATSADFDICFLGVGQHQYAIPRTARYMSIIVSSATLGVGLNIGTV